MKHTDPLPIGEIIERALEMDNTASEFQAQRAAYLWGEIVGPAVNRLTARRYVDRDATLHVYLTSGPLKQEIAFMAVKIVKAINDLLGSEVVKKLAVH